MDVEMDDEPCVFTDVCDQTFLPATDDGSSDSDSGSDDGDGSSRDTGSGDDDGEDCPIELAECLVSGWMGGKRTTTTQSARKIKAFKRTETLSLWLTRCFKERGPPVKGRVLRNRGVFSRKSEMCHR